MHEKYTNHFLLYTKIVHVTRTITYVTRTILHDCFVKDNIVTTYCTRLFHAFRKPTMIMIFFSGKKIISRQWLNNSCCLSEFFQILSKIFRARPMCWQKSFKKTKHKILNNRKKIALATSCICLKCKIAVYTWGTIGPWCDTWLTKLFTLFCNRASYWKIYRFF